MRGDVNDCSFIRTFTGKYFWPLEPKVEDVDIKDIAHALANQCRWTGHVREFYSVAQHSVLVANNLPVRFALEGLLHDATEAYLVDLARPVKHAPGLGEIYRAVEEKLDAVIREKFGLPATVSPAVKEIDNVLLWTEKRDFMEGDWTERLAGEPKLLKWKIVPWVPKVAEEIFLGQFAAYSEVPVG